MFFNEFWFAFQTPFGTLWGPFGSPLWGPKLPPDRPRKPAENEVANGLSKISENWPPEALRRPPSWPPNRSQIGLGPLPGTLRTPTGASRALPDPFGASGDPSGTPPGARFQPIFDHCWGSRRFFLQMRKHMQPTRLSQTTTATETRCLEQQVLLLSARPSAVADGRGSATG